MLTDIITPPRPRARAPEVTPCADCCRYELKLQYMREAYDLLAAALAAADQERARHR